MSIDLILSNGQSQIYMIKQFYFIFRLSILAKEHIEFPFSKKYLNDLFFFINQNKILLQCNGCNYFTISFLRKCFCCDKSKDVLKSIMESTSFYCLVWTKHVINGYNRNSDLSIPPADYLFFNEWL